MMPKKIETIHAFISVDSEGDEGIVGMKNPTDGSWMPLIGADEERIKSLMPIAKQIKRLTNKKIKLIKFSIREDIEEIL